jgi:hypothetical protein
MMVVRLLPVIVSALLFSAHILRFYGFPATLLFLALLLVLCIRRPWSRRLWQIVLSIAALVWIRTTVNLVLLRVQNELPWGRLAMILLGVIGLTVLSVIWLENTRIQGFYRRVDRPEPSS